MKFTYKDSKQKNSHWKQCEKLNAPFIEISRINHEYMNIFYDITNYHINLEDISNDMKNIYLSYITFFMCNHPAIDDLYTQYYFFNLIVKYEHAEFIAEKLYDYLLSKMALSDG
ncbi:hypothetical protein HC231_07925 [Brenneria izadpanahii]|uniref:Uncharacterized protein n=1 Tax=Brenneria izadpanahii TaxID=2722756 RepID=A0ABX7UQ86_9GAMM|nr:hypothetical protein [Brenneria izadpanahii]QTF07874.1 hypothetical protein HC231_07925 [Brenneria izadpanahii]